MTDLPRHGGGLDAAKRRWPDFRGTWLDLSTGINPWSYPIPDVPPSVWSRLPDDDLIHPLIQAARSYYQAPSPDHLLAGPGTGSFIRALPTLVAAGRAAILAPTYSEHGRAWTEAGHDVALVTDLAAAERADAVIIVNPNNPDGRRIEPQTILDFAAANPKRMVVIDQAFGDVDPGRSVIPHLPDNCVALASFGKFFGLAGLRLGFAFGTPTLLSKLASRLGEWPVSGPALWVGKVALSDRDWIESSRANLQTQRANLDAVLIAAELEIAGGSDLFRLIRHNDAPALWHKLGCNGILTRIFDYDPTWLRLGLPADQTGLERLGQAIKSEIF